LRAEIKPFPRKALLQALGIGIAADYGFQREKASFPLLVALHTKQSYPLWLVFGCITVFGIKMFIIIEADSTNNTSETTPFSDFQLNGCGDWSR
jgi:hypothetical protein